MVTQDSPSISSQVSNRRVSQLLSGELVRLKQAGPKGEFGVWGEVVTATKDRRHVYCELRDGKELMSLRARLPLSTDLAIGSYVRVVGTIEVSIDSSKGTASLVLCGAVDRTRSSTRLKDLKAAIETLQGQYSPRLLPSLPFKKVGVVSGSQSKARNDFTSALDGAVAVSITTTRLPSPAEVAVAIETASHESIDLLVVTRGGGGAMDLAVFDEPAVLESLARASSVVPVVLAIGHACDRQKASQLVSHTSTTPTAAGLKVRQLFYANKAPSLSPKRKKTTEISPPGSAEEPVAEKEGKRQPSRKSWVWCALFLCIGFTLGVLTAYAAT